MNRRGLFAALLALPFVKPVAERFRHFTATPFWHGDGPIKGMAAFNDHVIWIDGNSRLFSYDGSSVKCLSDEPPP